MARPPITPLDRAAAFEVSDLFFSTTDRKGHVKTCNDVFLDIAGYSSEEMLGAPHNIIRHPDMPKCVFDLLWEYLLSGRPIGAYVKNMAQSGEYYWVFALVLPIEGGFLSIRLKPTSEVFKTVPGVYTKLLATEKSCGKEWRAGMTAATAELLSTLSSIGFDSYDEFMVHCLRAEITARNSAMGTDAVQEQLPHRAPLSTVFQELPCLEVLSREAIKQAEFLEDISREIHRITLNASIFAARMGERGAALGVVSEQVGRLSTDVSDQASTLWKEQEALAGNLSATSFQVSLATLTSEMVSHFEGQRTSGHQTPEQQVETHGATCSDLSDMLAGSLDGMLGESRRGMALLGPSLGSFARIVARFKRTLVATHISHVTGRSIAAGLEDGEQYSSLLQEMSTFAEQGKERLDSLRRAAQEVNRSVEDWTERIEAAGRRSVTAGG